MKPYTRKRLNDPRLDAMYHSVTTLLSDIHELNTSKFDSWTARLFKQAVEELEEGYLPTLEYLDKIGLSDMR